MILLDTHIWIWYVHSESNKFPRAWWELFGSGQQLYVSSASCIEVAILIQSGRLQIGMAIDHWFKTAINDMNIQILPITPEVCVRFARLAPIHRDPFDRLIIATTIEKGTHLASLDQKFPLYPELEGRLLPLATNTR